MKFVPSILLVSFIGIAVFGIFSMSDAVHGHASCLAVAAQGYDCPSNASVLSFLTFHLDAFRSFSLATIQDSLLAGLIVLFSIILAIAAFKIRRSGNLAPPFPFSALKLRAIESSQGQKQRLTRWLSLREKRDPYSW